MESGSSFTNLRIEEEKFERTYEELWQEFGGVTVMPESENQVLRGFRLNESGQLFRDKIITAIVYATDINKADNFFVGQLKLIKKDFNKKQY